MLNLPNMLTLLRVALIPLLVVVFYLPWDARYLASGAIFAFAALTDLLDGYLARKLNQETPFGAFLDPVADKLIVAVALIILLERNPSLAFAIPVIVIISREIVISALREWMAEIGDRTSVAVSNIGKIKTALQMIAIIVLLAFDPSQSALMSGIGFVLLYAAALLTLWSMLVYLKLAAPQLLEGSQGRAEKPD
ncbi:CDP-diacylglycerol--glycerol-3-phosphate 3-phosphatidyltransferase [Gammaproteobacteria bacterium 53_120_T64]|nr:CDP-diacylglycerol--glycerol-3-phosphate 3-phosphatidyltransferase [Gammaproteobacteria bacterium 53_120_T64]